MATTTFGVNDALSNKLWAKKLTVEALKPTFFGRFMGTNANAMIHVKTETSKASGDKVTFGLRTQLTGDGVTESQTLEGNEESLTTYADSVFINELAHAVRVKSENSIDAQRVPFDLRAEARDGLQDWYSNRFDTVMFNHLAGIHTETRAVYNGNNTPTAPSAGRKLFVTGAVDELQVAGQIFNLNLIDKAVEAAKTATPLIRPIRVNGDEMYVIFLHPYQVYDLRTQTNAGQWLDIQKAALAGGKGAASPIFTGALGVYNNVIMHESTRVPTGINSTTAATITTVRRAVFCGAQAGALAWSQRFGGGDANYKWVEDLFDYERELGVSAQTIWGIKKTVFNSVDFGAITVSSYAVAH
jgi:N4-gp56 family major capsid protein